MSTKHFIDKLLEEPAGPQIPREKIATPESMIPQCDEISKDEVSDYHRRNNYVLHVPREYRRPIYCNPYPSQNSFCHSRPSKCLCPTCTQDVPPWLVDMRTPRFIDSVPGYQSHLRGSYVAARWESTRFANSSVVTRTKQQPCSMSAGGLKRKKRHRTAFTPTQLLGLENAFEENQYSVGEERKQLASFLGLSETQIKVWFQNRRTKWKRIRKEAEQMSTDDEEKDGNETESLQHLNRHPQYQIYGQRHTVTHIGADELCACEKVWPTGHACRGHDGY